MRSRCYWLFPGRNSGHSTWSIVCCFFLICIFGGGVQFGPLGTVATNRPIVPAPDDYDDGEIGGMIGRGNRSAWRKPAPVPLCPPQTPHACPDANPGRRCGKPATNRLSYGTAFWMLLDFKVLFVSTSTFLCTHFHSASTDNAEQTHCCFIGYCYQLSGIPEWLW
jgi:hypothetical protein